MRPHIVVTGIHWLPCAHPVCPCHRGETDNPVQCSGSEGLTWTAATSSSLLPAYRSDRYGHAISRLDRLISSKGDYFPSPPRLPSPHVFLSLSAATPWWSDSTLLLPNSFQQACCNMDKANTCYSMGSSYCDCHVAGISLGFQLDALRLSAARCYVISQRTQIVCGTLITTQTLAESGRCVHNQVQTSLTMIKVSVVQ